VQRGTTSFASLIREGPRDKTAVPRRGAPRILAVGEQHERTTDERTKPCWKRTSRSSSKRASASTDSGCVFDFAGDQREVEDLERQSGEPGFWEDMTAAQTVMRRIGELRARTESWQELRDSIADLLSLAELSEGDEAMTGEIAAETNSVLRRLDDLELQLALNGPHDRNNAILVVHSSEGGVDAQDFAEMLTRMYLRWADRRGFKAELLDETPGDEAGIKNATIEIRGSNAYGFARAEAGSHRLVRLSPFDAAHRRHTAFALVEVLPEIESDTEIDLNPDDVRVDTYRSSGAGGQHVNKTSSAVRLTHLPTGIVVTCQNERSQIQNRETAFKILRARLLERKLKQEADELSKLKGEHTGAGFGGNRIRSYVLHPYTMVTDHRTDTSTADTQAVLNGDIDPFVSAYLQQQMGVAV
jgi:peptide chain release factor 2